MCHQVEPTYASAARNGRIQTVWPVAAFAAAKITSTKKIAVMHFYQFNIGDYQSHTAHLDPLEDLAYRRLLDWCYLHEKPLPDDIEQVAKMIRMRGHTDCIASVLQEFFQRTEQGWWKERIGREIERAGEKSRKASESAKARWSKDANASPTQTEGNATQDTIHKTQDTFNLHPDGCMSATELADCPHQKIIYLYNEILPNLVKPRTWDGARQQALRARWVQASKPSKFSPKGYKSEHDGLAWWNSFFRYIKDHTSLPNGYEHGGRMWFPDLPWMCKAENFAKIIDGKYGR